MKHSAERSEAYVLYSIMKIPNCKKEKKLLLDGYDLVAGIDEAGRGAWAGPIVAGAVLITPENIKHAKQNWLIRDSKLLCPKDRQKAFDFIKNNFEYAVGVVDSSIIDTKGLNFSNQLVMDRALEALNASPGFIFVDGRGFYFEQNYENVIHGDEKIFSIAAASIVAKVIRDKIMDQWHEIYNAFGFYKNKGYGTKFHYQMIKKHGICSIHRRSYAPIHRLLSS